jgi:hypothetical protein
MPESRMNTRFFHFTGGKNGGKSGGKKARLLMGGP